MGALSFITLLFILSFHSLFSPGIQQPDPDQLKTYIIQLELPDSKIHAPYEDLERWYHSFLPSDIKFNQTRIIHTYHHVLKGFAAKLSPYQLEEIQKKEGFLSAWPERMLQLHTTHTPQFLGLHQHTGLWEHSAYGRGMIIGVLDTGILPSHPSFSDNGLPPPPTKWKGKCEFNSTACNNKIIGARNFLDVTSFPLDLDGHGTHTASTAAGNFVKDAGFFGNANGTAAGMAPLAHLAIYKTCTFLNCPDAAILAALDAAIDDGVDILSISLGWEGPSPPFYEQALTIGAFRAMQNGIFLSLSAGNGGPYSASLSNEEPWVLTVGASTLNRKIRATAVLGNNQELHGESGFQPKDFPPTQMPLVFPGANVSDSSAQYCSDSFLNDTDVKGKVVLSFCRRSVAEEIVETAGGASMIIINPDSLGYETSPNLHSLPATQLSYADGQKVEAYLNSTTMPTAAIVFKGTILEDEYSPQVASFSSRGPNRLSPGILKPDIIGPGFSVLAAWPVPVEDPYGRSSIFNTASGTSMSCPHLSGIAALLKSSHPDWSPAAIKSAIMTTADLVNGGNRPIVDHKHLAADVFTIGAGHVNPSRAEDPGLIYDIQPDDYVSYLCGLNYTLSQIKTIIGREPNCSSSIPEAQLNYPSFSITFGQPVQTYSRTATNAGEANSNYTVHVVSPPGIDVIVDPMMLSFSHKNQKLKYFVTFTRGETKVIDGVLQGFITWTSAKYSVRSPIAVVFK